MPLRQGRPPARASRSAAPGPLADRLHSAAIHLLRRLRREDDAGGVSAPRLSALSVVVFGGPLTIGELAAAEQVRPPTMSRLVAGLEESGWVERVADLEDGRVVRVRATPAGRALLLAGRARRVAALAEEIGRLTPDERRAIQEVLPLLEGLAGR
jgi:DNA-binding MarR family transcriptional regulator